MSTPSEHAATLAARLEGTVALDLRVTRSVLLRPWLREVQLRGDLAEFRPLAGQDLMISVADHDGRPRWRRYTVRRVDGDVLVLWIEPTTGGPGAAWATDARDGDAVVAVGPRGKVHLDASSSRHLFVVDATALAAMSSMVAALPGTSQARVVAHLDDDPGDLDLVDDVAADAEVVVVHDVDAATRAAVGFALDPTGLFAYVLGERSLTARAASALGDAGLDAARIAVKAYWRADRPNEDNGEPGRAEAPSVTDVKTGSATA
jgi:NADPH-dependent ferric siderophore reductase